MINKDVFIFQNLSSYIMYCTSLTNYALCQTFTIWYLPNSTKKYQLLKCLTVCLFILSGNETKLGMSRGITEPKLTAVDAMIDKLTGAIFLFQIVVVIVLGFAGNIWKDTEARKVICIIGFSRIQ